MPKPLSRSIKAAYSLPMCVLFIAMQQQGSGVMMMVVMVILLDAADVTSTHRVIHSPRRTWGMQGQTLMVPGILLCVLSGDIASRMRSWEVCCCWEQLPKPPWSIYRAPVCW
ncbi:hypothetical protein K431DRAFT_289549 [Polychaeton citri CBS 116435]|uniref:Uncharacterized protein n=1 Tax=Polychaeton citri CBS 116435 TaxID=1314669 RepID=A0A9P4UKH0_9PEZI|nr:hypothetical protein K431DRAFT_289549 [Polychaeton citri CBS 116435]